MDDKKLALKDITELYTVILVQHNPEVFPNWKDKVYILGKYGWEILGSDEGGPSPQDWERFAAGPYAYEVLAKPVKK